MIRILAVDDSAVIRRILREIFARDRHVALVTVRSGEEALAEIARAAPDLVLLDIILPGMDGLACLARIMEERPCPVIMVSGLTKEGARDSLDALAMGAIDVLPKPQGPLAPDLEPFASALRRKVRAALCARPGAGTAPGAVRAAPVPGPGPGARAGNFPIVLLGASTGGPPALEAVLGGLPADFPAAILVCQHMPAAFTGPLAERIDRTCALPVREVAGCAPLRPGRVHVARGEADLVVAAREGGLCAVSVVADPARRWHPSTDRMVESALRVADPRRLIGLLLTGMGRDGAAAMTELRARGGHTIAEAEATAVVWGMPRALVERGGAARVEPLPRIARALCEDTARRTALRVR